MPSVNSTIKRILREKDAGIASGTQAMLDLLRELQKQVIGDIGKAALGSWDAYSLKQALDSINEQIANFDAQAKREISGLLDDSWKTGEGMVDSALSAGEISVAYRYLSPSLLNTFKDFTFHKLEGLSNDAWYKIKGELNLGILGTKTPQEVAAAIGDDLTSRSIFSSIADRAEVITKTEMGRVFSQATQDRLAQAAQDVPDLEKQWLHAGHPKVARPAHVAANGQHVPVDRPFNIGGVAMMFPRSPEAPLEEVINCG